MDDHDSYRAAAAALLAVFCAHIFAVLVTAPPPRAHHRGDRGRIIAARTMDERGTRGIVRTARTGRKTTKVESVPVAPEPNEEALTA